MIRIALEGMGGDFAPQANLEGAVLALQKAERENIDIEVVIFGSSAWETSLSKRNYHPRLHITSLGSHPETMNGDRILTPAYLHSPIRNAMKELKAGRFQAVISAGRTGAVILAAILELDRCLGITRPAIAAPIPTTNSHQWSLLIDVGASLNASPHNLIQFALMGMTYCQKVWGIPEPKIALLNVGTEENVGGPNRAEAFQLLKESGLPFIGNIEGRDILADEGRVIITDGFTGNVTLKLLESLTTLTSKGKQSMPIFGERSSSPSTHFMDYRLWGGQP
ncbi:MAG: hypothetical protein ACK4OO_01595, partial [bacterium]